MANYFPRKVSYPYEYHTLCHGSKRRLLGLIAGYLRTHEPGWIPKPELGFTKKYIVCEPDIPRLEEIKRRSEEKWKKKRK